MNVYPRRPLFNRRPQSNIYRMFFWVILILVFIWKLQQMNKGDIQPLFLPTPTPTRAAESYALEGDANFTAGNLNEAILAYEEVVRVDPNNANTWAKLARIQTYSSAFLITNEQKKERLLAALESARRAVELAPDDSTANAILAFALDWNADSVIYKDDPQQVQKFLVEAEQMATRAIQLDSANKGLTDEQHRKLGDFVVWDTKTQAPKALTRDMVGETLAKSGIDPQLDFRGQFKLADGQQVEVATAWNLYQVHLRDYDLDTVSEITAAPKDLIERLAQDIATIRPCSIHQGEGINHWFHATEANRAAYLPLMLTGNLGQPGAGCHGWAGNYKAALFQGSKLTGPGFKGWIGEDPFAQNLDPTAQTEAKCCTAQRAGPDLQGDESAAAATAHAQRRRGNGGSSGKALHSNFLDTRIELA